MIDEDTGIRKVVVNTPAGRSGGVCLAALLAVAAVSSPAQRIAPARPAVPVEPISAILDAFRRHAVVALGEPHGNEQAHAFRLSLIRDPRFAAAVNDIVVEYANGRYQDLMDRFVRGGDVSDQALRQVWQNTTVPSTLWDRPIYEEFFRVVRAVNASLPPARQLRVLLGDPPIDWDEVHSADDLRKWQRDRDTYPAGLIRREVLARRRRALVIYGDAHLWRHTPAPNLVSLLERAGETKVFTISTNVDGDLQRLQADVGEWRAPSLAMIGGTAIGATDFGAYYPLPDDRWPDVRIDEQLDALLYLGPRSSLTFSQLDPRHCADRPYLEMRLRRMSLGPGGTGEMTRLRRYCAINAPKETGGTSPVR